VAVHRWYVQIWIYYGASDRSEGTRASAQTALDRRIVVPR